MSIPADPSTQQDQVLRSWKEIATHMRRGVRTVQRWEKDSGFPVHRIQGGGVFAYSGQLDAWLSSFVKAVPGPERETDWRNIAELIVQETDRDKVVELVKELSRLLGLEQPGRKAATGAAA